MKISPFGEINSSDLQEYYDGKISILGKMVEIDANFESESIDEPQLLELKSYLETVELRAKRAFEAISEDWDLAEESETARFYLQHHLDNFSEEEIKSIFGSTEVDKPTFLKSLNLERIGLYPEDEESYAIFDIQFSKESTDYLMAVAFNKEGDLSYISMDS